MGNGALIQLAAKGAQDTYLIGNYGDPIIPHNAPYGGAYGVKRGPPFAVAPMDFYGGQVIGNFTSNLDRKPYVEEKVVDLITKSQIFK